MTSGGNIETINEDEGHEIVPYPVNDEKPQKPYVGMVFSSIRDAEVVYQDYGRDNGFVIRKRSTYKAQRGRKVTRVLFTCSCEGVHKKKCSSNDPSKTRKTRSTMRTNCKAMMRIIRDRETDQWVVNDFTDDHNHVLVTPAKRVLMGGSDKHMPHSIMTRWIKEANIGEISTTNDLSMNDRSVGSEAMRITELCRRSTQLAYLAGKSEETYKVAMTFLDQAFEKVKELDSLIVENENVDYKNEMCTIGDDMVLVDPQEHQKRGKKRVRRAKEKTVAVASGMSESGAEISDATKKPRLCKTCNGHGHDSRNCKEKAKDKEFYDIPANGFEAIQTTIDLPMHGVDATLAPTNLGSDGVEDIEATTYLGTAGAEAIQTTTDIGINDADAIQTTINLPTNGVDAIQTTTDLPTDGAEAIQTTTDVPTHGAEAIERTADLCTNGVEEIQRTINIGVSGTEAIETTREISVNGVEAILTNEG